MSMEKVTKLWTSRSQYLSAQRCSRLRYLEYHAGSAGIGLAPTRKSIHLVIGGAVHAGLEVLLREGQAALDWHKSLFTDCTDAAAIEVLFNGVCEDDNGNPIKYARAIEDRAVVAALAELALMSTEGVELDAQEKADSQKLLAGAAISSVSAVSVNPLASSTQDSAITVTFDGWEMP